MLTVDAVQGRLFFKSEPPLEKIEAILQGTETRTALEGTVLSHEFHCRSFMELEQTIFAIAFFLPPILNLGFPDPPVVDIVTGNVGDTDFRWEYMPEECQTQFHTVDKEQLELFAFFALEEIMPLFIGIGHRRLAAALSYFHSGVRLHMAGHNRWEFLAETVLNYTKCLEVLFVSSADSMDDIRAELTKLGYERELIEADFIPVVLLRNSMDVGHHRIELFPQEELFVVYRYIEARESVFREMLMRILRLVKSGEYTLRQPDDLSPSRKSMRDFDKLVASMKKALGERLRPPKT